MLTSPHSNGRDGGVNFAGGAGAVTRRAAWVWPWSSPSAHALAMDRTERKVSKGKLERDLIVLVVVDLEGELETRKSKAYKARVMIYEGCINRLCTIWGCRRRGNVVAIPCWTDVRNDAGVRWGHLRETLAFLVKYVIVNEFEEENASSRGVGMRILWFLCSESP